MVHQLSLVTALSILGVNPFLPAVPRHLKQLVNVAKATANVVAGWRNALSLSVVAFQSRMKGLLL